MAGAVRVERAGWRGLLAGVLLTLAAGTAPLLPREARAGAQQYEELSASVRSALAAAIADRRTPEPLWESMEYRIAWLTAMASFAMPTGPLASASVTNMPAATDAPAMTFHSSAV